MTPTLPKPRLWPRWAVGPEGNRALFQCMGDIPHGWVLETFTSADLVEAVNATLDEPLGAPGEKLTISRPVHDFDPPKRKPGRPPKDKGE